MPPLRKGKSAGPLRDHTKAGSKTPGQLKAIFGLAKRQGIDKEQLEAIAGDITGGRTFRLSELKFHEADIIITRLGGDKFGAGNNFGRSKTAAPRTERHHRQKAGVVQIAQPEQLKLLNDLAGKRWGSNAESALGNLARRMHVTYPPRTTADTNKLIEAIKAMNSRENGTRTPSSANKNQEAA